MSAYDSDPIGRIAAGFHSLLLEQAREGAGAVDTTVQIEELLDRRAGVLSAASRALLAQRITERALGAGPLELLLRDPEVDEILVSGTTRVWVERGGRLSQTEARFESEDQLRLAIERLLAPAGRRVDEAEPLCDARLPDGSRINVVLPPLAVDGPALSIRRFRPRGLSADQLVELGSWSPELVELLGDAIGRRLNILVCGGTGSGKTTTLAAIAGLLGRDERVVTIEDTAELRLSLRHVVRLEARPASIEGRGEVTIRMLVRNALRMRPDRIIVGEVRGAEALDMLIALATGHDGSLTTIHAGSPAEALRRLETLALMADLGLPHEAIRTQVAQAIDLVVLQVRGSSGLRRVERVDRVFGADDAVRTETVYSAQ
ncbi:MAG: ATPase, T2SS/T4P/T4SS family [Solirubrobacterales bacterium]|nr:ATPase, T2SS/T4P/T4SS family [Solirubrobacterales bacterium]